MLFPSPSGGPFLRWFTPLLLLLLLIGAPGSGFAQVPDTIPRDTVPRDTLVLPVPPEAMVRDTLPTDALPPTAVDTLVPPPVIPAFPDPGVVGWAVERWHFDRQMLLRFNGLSLLELLERVPGFDVTRGGGFGHPAAAAVLGQGGGRLRVFRDGFELDPGGAHALDLQQIGLIDLESVRLERGPGEARLHLRTFRLTDPRAFSEIEAGTGNYQARILRAMLARTVWTNSVVTAAYDLTSSAGFRFAEPFSFTSATLRWDYSPRETAGLQLEHRRVGVGRESTRYPADFRRVETVLRARSRPSPDLTIEALGALTNHAPAGDDIPPGGSVPVGTDTLDLPLRTQQLGVRAVLLRSYGFAEAGVRTWGTGAETPSARTELLGRAGIHPSSWLAFEASASTVFAAPGSAGLLQLTARAGGVGGLTLFGSAALGERILLFRSDTLLAAPAAPGNPQDEPQIELVREARFAEILSSARGLRGGVEWSSRWGTVGGALLVADAGTFAPFGGGLDRGMPPLAVRQATGSEGNASLPLSFLLRGLSAEGWYVAWSSGGGRPFLPRQQFRGALTFHRVAYGGQFEPFLRIERLHRGSTLVPNLDRTAFVATDPYSQLNLSLQLRVLDVRAFLLYENILNEIAADVPGRFLPGARTMYGLRWVFRN